jgi:hypothetical protein
MAKKLVTFQVKRGCITHYELIKFIAENCPTLFVEPLINIAKRPSETEESIRKEREPSWAELEYLKVL